MTLSAVASMLALAAAPDAAVLARPEEAAGAALMQCVAHTLGRSPISVENAAAMAQAGLQFSEDPPPFLTSTRNSAYGSARYAHALSTSGQVWAVGYDQGTCLIFALGTSVSPVEGRLLELFSIPNAWKPEKPAAAAPGERKLQYGWKLDNRKLTALLSLRDLPGPAIGMTMVTIAWTTEKK